MPIGEGSVVATGDAELLVILGGPTSMPAGVRLFDRFRIIGAAPPRVFVIEVPGDVDDAEIASLPGVAGVTRGDVPPELTAGLDPAGSLFVRAWADRDRRGEGGRPGDGLEWDSEGFEPPDRPRVGGVDDL